MIDKSLLEKKIIIYGNGRYPLDFLYVFDMIQTAYWVDNVAYENVKSVSYLKQEKEECFVIVCKYDPLEANRNLDNIGLKYGKDYCNASDLFYLLDYQLAEKAKGRKIYVWGAGNDGHNFFHSYVEKNPQLSIAGVIDSNILLQGRTFFRFPIYTPRDLEVNLRTKNIFVIIATSAFFDDVKAQLQDFDMEDGEDFVYYEKLSATASFMMKETINDVPKINFVCMRIFKNVIVCGDYRISCCPWIKSGFTPTLYKGDDFSGSWYGNILKITRLSAINGTYSFCNKEICRYFHGENPPPFIDVKDFHYNYHRTDISVHATRQTFYKDTVFSMDNYIIKESDYPVIAEYCIDSTCNLHCDSCREHIYSPSSYERIQTERLNKRLRIELLPYVKRIKMSGSGEVFASAIYQSILFDKNIAKNVKGVNILSNGTLFTADKFQILEDLYNDIRVLISVDGAKKETVEKLRRGSNYEKLMTNLRHLGEKRRDGKLKFFALNFVVQRDNYLEMPDFVKMAFILGADKVKFSRIINWRWSAEKYDEQNMFNENIEPKPELAAIMREPILQDERVHLFRNLNWDDETE